MWRLPFLNLCFVLILIIVVAIQHSVSVLEPTYGRSVSLNYGELSLGSILGLDSDGKALRIRYDLDGLIDHLSDLWHRSLVLRQWMLEYERPFWQRTRAANSAEAALVETRFHIANAEVLAMVFDDSRGARTELDPAERFLISTHLTIADNAVAIVEAIFTKLMDAKTNLAETNSDNSERFERIKADLDRLIRAQRAAEM